MLEKSPEKAAVKKHRKRNIPCDLCPSLFLTQDGLTEHMKIHRQLQTLNYKCQICEEDFLNAQGYRKHMFMHNLKIFNCESCGASFKYLQSYIRHMREYKEPHYFPCGKCGKVFKRQIFLNKHYCCSQRNDIFESALCETNLITKEIQSDLQETESDNYENADLDTESLTFNLSFEESSQQEKSHKFSKIDENLSSYQCSECEWFFTTKFFLRRHQKFYAKSHFFYPCCGKILKATDNILRHLCEQNSKNIEGSMDLDENHENSTLAEPLIESDLSSDCESEEEKPYKCERCSASFFRQHSLKNHLNKYPGNHDFKCEKCKKNFKDEKTLGKHLCIFANSKEFKCSCLQNFNNIKKFKQHIGLKRPYICCTCKKKNETFNNLINHIRTHTKEKPFVCNFCKKSFSVKESLLLHLRCHKGIKPYKCSKCTYSSTTKWNLQLHEKRHNADRSSDKKFLCAQCGVSFYLKHHLRRHITTHEEEKSHLCKVCGKLFSQSSYLTKHLENHKNDFNCPECDAKLSKKDMYRHHIDTGHFEFVCDLCQKVFLTKYYHERHVKGHDKPKPQQVSQKLYSCELCNKLFACKQNLDKHFQRHLTAEKNPKFCCHLCGRTFLRTNFNRHMKTHKLSVPSHDTHGTAFQSTEYLNQIPIINFEENEARATQK